MSDFISVIVPTLQRPASLRHCLVALGSQTRLPDLVLVVVRDFDHETLRLLSGWTSRFQLKSVVVDRPGQVAAMNAALAATGGDVLAFVDDDTEPRSDWLERVAAHFAEDSTLGGLGGLDYKPGESGTSGRQVRQVGKLQWFGRTIGNHHLMTGSPGVADILKGANMSYRVPAISGLLFDERLRGTGAQVHSDMAFSLAVRRRGWKLMCDPSVVVDHHSAERFDEDARGAPSARATANAVHNETLVLLQHLHWWQRPIFLVWSVLVGTRAAPGLGQWVRMRFWPSEVRRTPLGPSLVGRIAGVRTWTLALAGRRWQPSPEH